MRSMAGAFDRQKSQGFTQDQLRTARSDAHTHVYTHERHGTVLCTICFVLCDVIYIYIHMIGLTARTARTQPKRPACHRPHATNTAPCFTAHRSSWAESTRTCASADTPTVQIFLQCSFIFTGLFLRQQAVVLLWLCGVGVAGG